MVEKFVMPGLDHFLSRLQRVKQVGDGEWVASCPAAGHGQGRGDVHPSLSINRGNGFGALIKCHAGCRSDDIIAGVGMTWPDILPPKETAHIPSAVKASRIVATYDYTDEAGTLLYQAVRYDPKGFKQRRPDPNHPGDWIWNLKGIPRVLYHLPDVTWAVAKGETVYIVEGEKDADNLHAIGITATCNVGGAGKWKPEYSEVLRGAKVIVIPDADEPGRKHASQVYDALCGIAENVKILPLPGSSKDISDWIAAGGTRKELERLASEAENAAIREFEEKAADATAEISLIETIYTSGNLPTATDAAWRAIERANVPESRFRYGGVPVRVGADDSGRPAFEVLTIDRMRHDVARVAPWKAKRLDRKTGTMVEREVPPPIDVIKDILATPSDRMPLPVVSGIAEVPTFAADGTLCNRPGYNPGNRTYYAPPPGLIIPEIPVAPTEEDVRQARDLLIEPILEMRFAEDSDMAHTLALGILPYVRDIVGPCAPIHLFDAPIHGSGKTKSATVMLMPPLGEIMFVTQADDDEFRKRITSQAIAGRPVFFLDNVTRPLNSAVLSSAITAATWTDRILGKSMEASVPNRMIWVVTGNNVALSGELARRCVRIRIDPETDQPWLRTGFRIPNLEGWVVANRGRLVAAALTLVQAWINDGMTPWTGPPLGSFEPWSRVIGGILDRAGIGGFLGNLDQLYEDADVENNIWREFITAWWERHQDSKVGTAELFPIADKVEGLDLGKNPTEKGQRTALGSKLRSKRNMVVGGYKITPAGTVRRAQIWRLIPIKPVKI